MPERTGELALGSATWVGGRLVEAGHPAITADDRGLVGDGVFEAIKVVDGVPFALTRHLDRLLASAKPLGLPVDLADVRAAIDGVLGVAVETAGSPCRLRVTVTAGPTRMGTAEPATQPTVMAAVAPMAAWGPTSDVVVVPWVRNERGALAGLKTLSYLENGLAVRYARSHGADEGIFANTQGHLCEGAGSNIFVVDGGVVTTPPLSSGCLAGVTRDLVLEWVPGVVEADLPLDALAWCDEAFLTSTSRDIHPIATIDGRTLATAPGSATAAAMAVFAERAAAEPDP